MVYVLACGTSVTSEKTCPWNLEHAFCDFVWTLLVLSDFRAPGQIFIIWLICTNDYASKACIEILCKKAAPLPQDVFSEADLFGNTLDDGTIARMST